MDVASGVRVRETNPQAVAAVCEKRRRYSLMSPEQKSCADSTATSANAVCGMPVVTRQRCSGEGSRDFLSTAATGTRFATGHWRSKPRKAFNFPRHRGGRCRGRRTLRRKPAFGPRFYRPLKVSCYDEAGQQKCSNPHPRLDGPAHGNEHIRGNLHLTLLGSNR